ncbi:hypothetical protein GWK47_054927 [Chionoecetes opilio]|uniref:Uncharacterized protein n=1 Tax=Chionoecetes opilio TaxID=41210 RepID=A0A8J4Y6L0_CHIOP|nr:hypothetical protein GWK47_054927 [Chionoecetes opilio]
MAVYVGVVQAARIPGGGNTISPGVGGANQPEAADGRILPKSGKRVAVPASFTRSIPQRPLYRAHRSRETAVRRPYTVLVQASPPFARFTRPATSLEQTQNSAGRGWAGKSPSKTYSIDGKSPLCVPPCDPAALVFPQWRRSIKDDRTIIAFLEVQRGAVFAF